MVSLVYLFLFPFPIFIGSVFFFILSYYGFVSAMNSMKIQFNSMTSLKTRQNTPPHTKKPRCIPRVVCDSVLYYARHVAPWTIETRRTQIPFPINLQQHTQISWNEEEIRLPICCSLFCSRILFSIFTSLLSCNIGVNHVFADAAACM